VAQLLVRNFEDNLKLELQRRAKRNRRSMEDEARHILRDALTEKPDNKPLGLGSQIAADFRGIGVKLERLPFEEARPAKFR
jgi:plasmid stability protein